jgi:hypothetical protein
LIFFAAVLLNPQRGDLIDQAMIPYLALLANSAHFAASTVRLYTRPGTYETLPFLTMAFPLVALGLVVTCLGWAGSVGPHLQSLYLTWSPFHYAAQLTAWRSSTPIAQAASSSPRTRSCCGGPPCCRFFTP